MDENYCGNFTRLSFFNVQVLFCYEQFDELTLLHLREFDKKKMISVETDIVVDHYKEEKFEDSKPGPFPSHTVPPVQAEQRSRTTLPVMATVLTHVFLSFLSCSL